MNEQRNEERNKSINTQTHKHTNVRLCVLLWFCAFMYLRFYAFLFFTFSFIFSKSELHHALFFLPRIIE